MRLTDTLDKQADSSGSFTDHLRGNPLQDCFRFWYAQREGKQPPLKRRMDPTAMPRKILPYLFIYELLGSRFRCRLAGTRLVDAFREDPTGHYLDELLSLAAAESRMHLFKGVVESGVPVVYGGKLAAGPNQWMSFKRLLLPVSTTGASIDIVFGMVIFPQIDRAGAYTNRFDVLDNDFVAWALPSDLLAPNP